MKDKNISEDPAKNPYAFLNQNFDDKVYFRDVVLYSEIDEKSQVDRNEVAFKENSQMKFDITE